MQPKNTPPPRGPLASRFSSRQLLHRFRQVFPEKVLSSWLRWVPLTFYERAFTVRVALWYFVFQRLGSSHTLGGILADALAGGADRLSPKGKPLSRQLRSTATTALSDARQRLPLPLLAEALKDSAQRVRSWVEGFTWRGWSVALLDGTTIRLRPYGDIPAHFPPHRSGGNRHPYWCLMRVVTAFCLNTGLLLDCAWGATRLSEQVLAAKLLERPWPKTLFIADRNFGVYSVVRAVQSAAARMVVRLTQSRAGRLARDAKQRLQPGLDTALLWTPTRHDKCPEGLARDAVAGRLLAIRIERPGFRPQVLYLFTTLTDPECYSAADLAQLYGQRWHVELDLRYVKTEMELGALECKSAQMAQKELLAGLVAYNLIRSVMLAAAARTRTSVLVLSFSRARQLFLGWLLRQGQAARDTLQSWERLLDQVARCRHPARRKPRPAEPRAIRYFKQEVPRLIGDRALARLLLKTANANTSKN